ncbi:MAG: LPS assembly lipoprotein LptE [Crocinitomicaceae bacterium]
MRTFTVFIFTLPLIFGCWPSSVSFMDKGSMPEEWKTFSVITLDNNAPNTPLSYATSISEKVKDGIQNNTRLLLNSNSDSAEVIIEGVITNYVISPIALLDGDNASQNRLSISVKFAIFITKPEDNKITITSTRFVDYDSNTDLGTVEGDLLEEVNDQIVQDVINKLLSNW